MNTLTAAPPAHVLVPDGARPFWDAIVQARPRDTWNPVDMASAANLARVQFALEAAPVGSDDHVKLTRLALALTRVIPSFGILAGLRRLLPLTR